MPGLPCEYPSSLRKLQQQSRPSPSTTYGTCAPRGARIDVHPHPSGSCFSATQTTTVDTVLLASVDLDECISRLYKKELLAESVIEAICAKTKELLMRESNVVHVRAPVTVVGDIHGQFYDLIEIFKIGGWCPDTNYLFLGLSPSSFFSFHRDHSPRNKCLLGDPNRRLRRSRHVQR